MERLLITGVDSVVGSNLALHLAQRFEVVGLYGEFSTQLPGCETMQCDLDDPCRVGLAVQQTNPRWIVHCGPLARSSWDLDPLETPPTTESLVAARLASAAAEANARLTVITSDIVASGRRLFRDESSTVTAEDGWPKAVLDTELALAGTSALVVRTHAYGWCPRANDRSWAAALYESLSSGRQVAALPRAHATPILATDLGDLLVLAYRAGLTGLLHLSGAERTCSRHFAEELSLAMDMQSDAGAVRTKRRPVGNAVECSLACDRAHNELQVRMPLLREGLQRFVLQARDFRWKLRSSGYTSRVAA